jgi:hypothetical protein
MIVLPTIQRVKISDYELYPGRDGAGIEHDFLDGVTIVAGVNGLGKTTFLNAIFRAFLGDREISGLGNIGDRQLKVSKWPRIKFFAERVLDGAENATIEVSAKFLDDELSIKRSLNNLRLVELTLNDVVLNATEEQYEDTILNLCGLTAIADFYLLLRYLAFFLEDRLSAVWDRKAMDEIFRILFWEPSVSSAYTVLRDEIRVIDSDRRNQKYQLTKKEKKLEKDIAAKINAPNVTRELETLRNRQEAVLARLKLLKTDLDERESTLRDHTQKLERTKIQLEEQTRTLKHLHQHYFAASYPSISDVANYVLISLDSGMGCLICGNRDEGLAESIHESIKEGTCPLCHSGKHRHENVADEKSISSNEIEKQAHSVELERERLFSLSSSISRLEKERIELKVKYLEESRDLKNIESELQQLNASFPTDSQLDRAREIIEFENQELIELRFIQEEKEKKLANLLAQGNESVERMVDSITSDFSANIKEFLAEECELRYKKESGKIAQEKISSIPLEFPRFTVYMTSSTSPDVPQPREEKSNVSESQAEFVDLAFRMAMLKAMSANQATHSPCSLILETPEKSLDSVFISRAGNILRRFTLGSIETDQPMNQLIVSTNLNKEDMIPALFGLPPGNEVQVQTKNGEKYAFEKSKVIPTEEREERIINLLFEARSTAATRKFDDEYKLQYELSLHPEWEARIDYV